jgi:hypothetical protein
VDFARGDRRVRLRGIDHARRLVFAHGEERDVAEQLVARPNHAIETGFLQTKIREKRGGVGRFELRDFSSISRTATAPWRRATETA